MFDTHYRAQARRRSSAALVLIGVFYLVWVVLFTLFLPLLLGMALIIPSRAMKPLVDQIERPGRTCEASIRELALRRWSRRFIR